MSASQELVSWDEPQSIGPITGMEWAWPRNWPAMVALANDKVEITDDVIMERADGQRRHLEGMEYPEGYHAVRVMTDEGEEVLDADAMQQYGGLLKRTGEPVRSHVLMREDRILPVGGNRRLVAYDGLSGPESAITPLKPHAFFKHPDGTPMLLKPMTRAAISPQGRTLKIESFAQDANENTALMTDVEIETFDDELNRALARLTIRTLDCHSSIVVGIDGQGRAASVQPFGRDILKVFGLSDPLLEASSERGFCLTNSACRQAETAARVVMSALGNSEGAPLDLPATAAAIYRNMGQPGFNPESAFIFR